MKILITGASGYLGGRLTEYLYERYDLRLASRNLERLELPYANSVECYNIDWDDQKSIEKSVNNVEVVVHLAGLNAKESLQDPSKAIEINKDNTQKILEFSIKNKVKKFIYLSTAHVYSNPLEGDINESSQTFGDHPYATSHLDGEKVLLKEHKEGRIEGIIIRLSNAFGYPILRETNCWMLIANDLCRQVILNNSMKIRSNGKQRRNFISISNTVRSIEHFIKMPRSDDPIFNVGSHWNPTIRELVELISSRYKLITNKNPRIEYEKSVDNNSVNLNYKIDKLLESGFKFNSQYSKESEIDCLIKKCIEFYGN